MATKNIYFSIIIISLLGVFFGLTSNPAAAVLCGVILLNELYKHKTLLNKNKHIDTLFLTLSQLIDVEKQQQSRIDEYLEIIFKGNEIIASYSNQVKELINTIEEDTRLIDKLAAKLNSFGCTYE